MENSWFPLENELIENEDFRKLTATEKLYLWQVMSEFNLYDGEFYKADIEYAVTLKLSIEKIRKARAKLAKLGFIEMIPGKQDMVRKKNIATRYKAVKGMNMTEGKQWSQIDRPTFERLIDYIRYGKFTHEDVVCWVYIRHIHWCKGGVFASVSKSELVHITNMPKVLKRVRYLLDNFKYQSNETLFDFAEAYRSVTFKKIRTCLFNQEHLDQRRKDIEKAMDKMRSEEQEKEKNRLRENGHTFLEDLIPGFEIAYKVKYGKKPEIIRRLDLERKLNDLGDPDEVWAAMRIYLSSELSYGRKHTLVHFINNAGEYMEKVRA